MKEPLYDRLLVVLALLAPLGLVMLSKWQSSLEDWYVPMAENRPAYFDAAFERDASAWLQRRTEKGLTLYLLLEKDCACTVATRRILQESMLKSGKQDLQLRELELSDLQGEVGSRVRTRIPATPTLLVAENGRLLYAGPATSGNFCTTDVQRIMGLNVAENPQSRPVFNTLDKGCYCPVRKATTPR